ncbi:ADP-ribosylglycohydrolase family protein [Enterobacter cloacae]|uniref:ADP-ribosylglycohydrolase family protein n=1 Tax=Enterobacter cloacae complex TaxID=354276 RepID=UPI002005D2B1|nr:ADP-ribosylglycohydrolase family protein [Enterobacter asburiae]MCK7358096.1 ADP-ribosylglycohydrolase family protein [Enterobacter roggenkampii]MCM7835694.1 ADP-ribosylglycohydrolase family protein [Enterobacter asburiae]HDW3276033.1 ADP-ribosylglycohydrolase family protein [Enterobacter asburiae]
MTDNLSFSSRVLGMLYGVAFGDALGGPVEKLSARQIQEKYGKVTSINQRWHRMDEPSSRRNNRIRGNGIITDDTLMTLCLMEVYDELGRHIDAWDMAGPFVRKIAWEPRWVPELDREALVIERLFYPEKWIFHRLQLAACDPRQGGVGNMVNCGAAMYAAPIGVINACNPTAAYQEAINFTLGHQQSYGLEAAGVFAACVSAAFIPGITLDAIVDIALQLAKDGTRKAISATLDVACCYRGQPWDYLQVVDALHEALLPWSPMGDDLMHGPEKAGVPTMAYQPSRLMSIEELPMALAFCLLREGDFRGAVEDSINSGRDTDSIGVMSGAILGALHGNTIIEPDVLTGIEHANRLDLRAAALRFTETAQCIIQKDLNAAKEYRYNVMPFLQPAQNAGRGE